MERRWAGTNLRAITIGWWQLRGKDGGGRREEVERAIKVQLGSEDLVGMLAKVVALYSKLGMRKICG